VVRERYPSTAAASIPPMPPKRKSGESAARAKRALERSATTLGARLAQSAESGWRRMSPSRRAKLEQLAANVRERASERGDADRQAQALELPGASERLADVTVASVRGESEVSDVEVHDLRADLARELERLAGADISAARGLGSVASDSASADGQA
jgi:hypothetical protein